MGTTVEVAVESEDPSTISRIAYVFDYFRSMEAEFSRFKEDSVLSQLNKAGQLSVSSRFLRLFALSKEAYEKTGGIFNPLVDVSAIGYSKSFDSGEFVQNDRHLATDFSSVYSTNGEIVLGRGRALDFGGIAKGYAVDNAALILLTFGYDHFFVNAGGDIFAHGFNGKENGWRIGIENPFNGGTLATFLLKDKAVATSGSYKRRWMSEGHEYHHILDPKTGENHTELVSVTLLSDRCVSSDAYAKALFNLSADKALEFASKNGMDALVVTKEGQTLHTEGLLLKYDIDFHS